MVLDSLRQAQHGSEVRVGAAGLDQLGPRDATIAVAVGVLEEPRYVRVAQVALLLLLVRVLRSRGDSSQRFGDPGAQVPAVQTHVSCRNQEHLSKKPGGQAGSGQSIGDQSQTGPDCVVSGHAVGGLAHRCWRQLSCLASSERSQTASASARSALSNSRHRLDQVVG